MTAPAIRLDEPEHTITRQQFYENELHACIHDVGSAVRTFGCNSREARLAGARAERVRVRLREVIAEATA